MNIEPSDKPSILPDWSSVGTKLIERMFSLENWKAQLKRKQGKPLHWIDKAGNKHSVYSYRHAFRVFGIDNLASIQPMKMPKGEVKYLKFLHVKEQELSEQGEQ